MLREYELVMTISPRELLGSDAGRVRGYLIWQFLPSGGLVIDTNALGAAFATMTVDDLRRAIPTEYVRGSGRNERIDIQQ